LVFPIISIFLEALIQYYQILLANENVNLSRLHVYYLTVLTPIQTPFHYLMYPSKLFDNVFIDCQICVRNMHTGKIWSKFYVNVYLCKCCLVFPIISIFLEALIQYYQILLANENVNLSRLHVYSHFNLFCARCKC
jgi:hypothetical protein